ncbi:unnamed protein product [Musa textilis]
MEISKHAGVVSVFPNGIHTLHTTRSWDFLGLERNGRVPPSSIWAQSRFGEDVIIGNLDTGTSNLHRKTSTLVRQERSNKWIYESHQGSTRVTPSISPSDMPKIGQDVAQH